MMTTLVKSGLMEFTLVQTKRQMEFVHANPLREGDTPTQTARSKSSHLRLN